MFAIICWAYFPVVFAFYPETSRRTLEDMDEIFLASPGPIVCGKGLLTQRGRPQAFVDAEARRIGEGAASEIGAGVLDRKDLETAKAAHIEDDRHIV